MSDSIKAPPAAANDQAPTTDTGETDDPEILTLLGFEPVPRKVVVEGGWSPEAQREFIALLGGCGGGPSIRLSRVFQIR